MATRATLPTTLTIHIPTTLTLRITRTTMLPSAIREVMQARQHLTIPVRTVRPQANTPHPLRTIRPQAGIVAQHPTAQLAAHIRIALRQRCPTMLRARVR
jgi:hypothetical protein